MTEFESLSWELRSNEETRTQRECFVTFLLADNSKASGGKGISRDSAATSAELSLTARHHLTLIFITPDVIAAVSDQAHIDVEGARRVISRRLI